MSIPSANSRPATPTKWYGLGLLLALAPVVIYLGVLAKYSTGVPGTDDFESLLNFVGEWSTHHALGDRWQLFTGQFIAHRILFTRAIALLDYSITGHCDLFALQMVGWVGWLFVVGGLTASFSAVRRQPWLALPVTLLLMQPQGYSNLLSAIGLGNTWIVAFVFFSLWAAHAQRRGLFIVSLGLGLLAPTAFANGLLVFPAAAAGLFLNKRFARTAWFVAAGALAFGLYLHHYEPGLGAFTFGELFRKAAIMTGGLVVLGRTPEPVSLYAGVALLLVVATFLVRPRVWRELPVGASFLLFLVLTVFMAARGRIGIMEDYYMLQDRYRIYGLMMIATMYLITIELAGEPARRRYGALSVMPILLFCVLSYATYYSQLGVLRNWLQGTAMNAQFGGCFPCAVPKDWPMSCQSIERAAKLDVYHLPELLSPEDTAFIRNLATTPPNTPELFELEKAGGVSGYYVQPRALYSSPVQPAAPDFGVLFNDDRPTILPVSIFRARFSELLPRFSFLSDRYGFIFPDPLVHSGRHALYGLKRGPDGRLMVVFSTPLVCP